jgi:hypothetical protein
MTGVFYLYWLLYQFIFDFVFSFDTIEIIINKQRGVLCPKLNQNLYAKIAVLNLLSGWVNAQVVKNGIL